MSLQYRTAKVKLYRQTNLREKPSKLPAKLFTQATRIGTSAAVLVRMQPTAVADENIPSVSGA